MAEMSDFKRAQVGCVAVIGNKVVATGFSQQRTHPMQDYYNRFRDFHGQKNVSAKLHAEIAALCQIHSLGIDASRVDLYIVRKCKSREYGMARPCAACMAAIKEFGIKNLFYSTDDGLVFEKLVS